MPWKILKVRSSNTFIHSAENDRYHNCAGHAMKKCFLGSTRVFEHEQGDRDASDDASNGYIRCIEERTKTGCNYRIMRHLFNQIEAFKKHIKQLEMLESEERQG